MKSGLQAIWTGDDGGYIQLTFSSEKFTRREPGYVKVTKVHELSFDILWGIIIVNEQSNAEGSFISDCFSISITRANPPVGRRKRCRSGEYNFFDKECYKGQSIVSIDNSETSA